MTAVLSTSVQVPAPGVYALDPARCAVKFRARHLFGLGKVVGSFTVLGGELVVGDPVQTSSLVARVAAGSLDSGSPTRDRTVTGEKFLDADGFPVITFRSTSVEEVAARACIRGELTVRERTAPVVLKVVQSHGHGRSASFRAYGDIDRYAFGLRRARGLAGRHLLLELSAEATRST